MEIPQKAIDVITALTLEREKLTEALQDSLCFYDRVTGTLRGDGFSSADVIRLAEIRALAYGHTLIPVYPDERMAIPGVSRPVASQTPPVSYGKRSDAPKTSHIDY